MKSIDIKNLTPKQMYEVLLACRKDPLFFSKNILGGGDPWDKQIEIMKSVRDNRRTVVKSGHAVGKSFISARIALWFLQCWENSIVVTTAPTWTQVEKILWGELRSQFKSSLIPLRGELLTTQIKISDKHYAIGISTDECNRLQGFHSDYALIIVDEAPGVHSQMYEAIEGLMTDENCRLLLIGNPTSNSGEFYSAFKSPLYNKITISCYDSPNVKAGKTVIKGLVSKTWCEERKQEWGQESPLYQSRVLAEFPQSSENVLVPLKYIEIAENNVVNTTGYEHKILAVDVAGGGENYTVYVVREGDTIKSVKTRQGVDQYRGTLEVVGKISELIAEEDFDAVVIDDTGVGTNISDLFSSKYSNVFPFVANASPVTNPKCINLRADMYCALAQ